MRAQIARAAFRLRGSAGAGFVVRQSFAHASRVLPLRRVAEGDHVIAFHHPVPGFEPLHVLLVPKFSAPSVLHLTDAQREQVSAEVEVLAHEALDSLELTQSGFLVVVNGGQRQDVRQVHFHLLTDGYELARAPSTLEPGVWTDAPDPASAVHRVHVGRRPVLAGLTYAAERSEALELERRGYSMIWDARVRAAPDVAHLTAGPVGIAGTSR